MASSIPSIKDQSIILDRVTEYYFNWIDSHIEIMTALSWEISFNKLRSAVIYLVDFWYLEKLETSTGNEFYIKVTKKWIEYYEEIFSKKDEVQETGFKEKINNITENINAVKTMAISAVALMAIFWASNDSIHSFIKSTSANIFWWKNIDNELFLNNNDAINYLEKKFKAEWQVECSKISDLEVACLIKNPNSWKNIQWKLVIKTNEKPLVNEIKLFRNKDWEIKIKSIQD